jgi:D-sedoheptulose 7-phosphate isomerase
MLGIELALPDYLTRLQTELARLDQAAIRTWADLLFQAWHHGRAVFLFGNGGSATTASHMAEDLGKSLLHPDELSEDAPRRLKVLSLTDNVGWLLAIGNDCGYDQVFLQQLKNYAAPGDLVIAISGSGNSPNVLRAVEWANRHGLTTFALTGYDGGRLKQLAAAGLHVDLPDMGMVESIHLCVFHWVLNDVYARIHEQGRYAAR